MAFASTCVIREQHFIFQKFWEIIHLLIDFNGMPTVKGTFMPRGLGIAFIFTFSWLVVSLLFLNQQMGP